MAKKPLYRQIADTISEKIRDSEYKVGEALPTEAQLTESFSVSRVTIRQALKLLIENEELESIQGSGTYVKENNNEIFHQSTFNEKWDYLNQTTNSEVLTFEIIQPSIAIAKKLNIEENDRIFHIKRLRSIEKKPITLEETWMPLHLFPDLTIEVMEKSKYDYIEKSKGMTIDRCEQEIIPVLPSKEVAKFLQVDPNFPILEKRTRSFLSDGTIFEYNSHHFSPTDYKFTLVAKRQNII